MARPGTDDDSAIADEEPTEVTAPSNGKPKANGSGRPRKGRKPPDPEPDEEDLDEDYDDEPIEVPSNRRIPRRTGDDGQETRVAAYAPAAAAAVAPAAAATSVTVAMSPGVRRALKVVGFVLAVILLSAGTMMFISAVAPTILPNGPQGATGLQGAQGAQGERGPRGRTGPRGRQGKTGANGINGANGANGQDGATIERACSNDPSVPLPYC